ncbi:MAG: hypothetical protein M3450_09180 [Actinomycetota bacterium]|nr:hypothetical protein [Actinomycetota bacterium]
MATAAMAAGLAIGSSPAGAASVFVESRGELSDYAPSAYNATDGATADLWAVAAGGSTTFFLFLSGLDPASAGNTYGVHIHVGPCVKGAPLTSGPHYNTGGTPSTDTEVWLDFTVLPGGYAFSYTTVPFTIEPGDANSMVIHAQPTQEGGATPGAAGGRQACLPVEF